MLQRQHVTTRRAFITTLGFGGVSLYGAWAFYGAAPLPFSNSQPSVPPTASEGHGGHGGGGGMTPEEFLRKHEEFIARFELPDGSVAPRAEAGTTVSPAMSMSVGGYDAHAMPEMMSAGDQAAHSMPDMAAMAPVAQAPSDHAGDGGAGPDQAPHEMAGMNPVTAPVDVYLQAYRFGFTPEELRLEVGQAYRFRMMASDVTHGASLSFGQGSRIIRLRPNVVSEQTITFHRPGPILVYCTVYCGPAHDMMKARIVVA